MTQKDTSNTTIKFLDDTVHKILVIGPGGSGKTAFVNKLVNGDMFTFTEDNQAKNVISLETPRGTLKLSFDSKRDQTVKYTAVFIVYDCNEKKTRLEWFYREARRISPLVTVVIANKADLEYTHIERTEYPLYYLSTLRGVGLYSPFRSVVEAITSAADV